MRLTVLLLLLVATRAAAQTPPAPPLREHVVVTATVAPVPFDALTRSVTTITREELEKLGVTSVADALRLLPGVDAKARGPRDVQTDFSIRAAAFGQSLVLVDGLRLNDSQSGHHNGDIPMPLAAIDRIEVLAGTGSAVHGADALGGTINILSRRDRHALATVAIGQHGYVSAQGSASGLVLPEAWLVTGWGARSSGFAFDRDFAYGGGAVRGRLDDRWTVDVRHQRKAFGANQFYGPSPSKEWTDQTLAAMAWQRTADAWAATVRVQWRNHGDHFRWDINRPGFAENEHRTDAAEATVTVARPVSDRAHLAFGAMAGGDWIRSSGLGAHRYARAAGYGELRWHPAPRAVVQGGLRLDRYSTFGGSWSPTLSSGVWLTPALRLRASTSRLQDPDVHRALLPGPRPPGTIRSARRIGLGRRWRRRLDARRLGALVQRVQARRSRRHRLGPAERGGPVADDERPRRDHAGRRSERRPAMARGAGAAGVRGA